jgi:hypothetical protein
MALINGVNAVLAEYHAVLPLTIRQVFYRLVTQGNTDKTEHGYKRLCEAINKGRRARLIDMAHIRDDGFSMTQIETFGGVDEVIAAYKAHAEGVRVDRQEGQGRRLMLWCESRGMKPMLERVCIDYGVPVASSGGFDSVSTKYQVAVDLARGDSIEVLHLGDHDPSGVHIFSSLAEDITAFTRAMGGDVEFTRLAVTPEQRTLYNLPTAPPKATDRRSFAGNETVQCEAIPPDILLEIVEQAITDRMDMAIYQALLGTEQGIRTGVLQVISE